VARATGRPGRVKRPLPSSCTGPVPSTSKPSRRAITARLLSEFYHGKRNDGPVSGRVLSDRPGYPARRPDPFPRQRPIGFALAQLKRTGASVRHLHIRRSHVLPQSGRPMRRRALLRMLHYLIHYKL
jgi:hypothetical protein